MWWIYDENKDHPLYKAYMAAGNGGQYIVIIPKSKMIIITKNYNPMKNLLEKIFNIKL